MTGTVASDAPPAGAPDVTLPPDAMIDPGQVADLLRVSRATVNRWVAEGKLPPPIRIMRTARWPRATIARLLLTT